MPSSLLRRKILRRFPKVSGRLGAGDLLALESALVSASGRSRRHIVIKPGHPVHPPSLKLARAREQVEALEADIRAFILDSQSNLCIEQFDVRTKRRRVVYRAPNPPDMWPVRIGEVVHNMRSALEHVVWQLVLHDGAEPTPKRTGFPICLVREKFESKAHGAGLWKLAGISDNGIAIVRQLQPYQSREDVPSPDLHPLHVLNELWNIDKHRALHLCVTDARLDHLDLRIRDGFKGCGEGVIMAPEGPLEDGAELCSFPPALLANTVQMNTQIGFEIRIDERSPMGPGFGVTATLRRVGSEVDRVLRALFPLFTQADPSTVEIRHKSFPPKPPGAGGTG